MGSSWTVKSVWLGSRPTRTVTTLVPMLLLLAAGSSGFDVDLPRHFGLRVERHCGDLWLEVEKC